VIDSRTHLHIYTSTNTGVIVVVQINPVSFLLEITWRGQGGLVRWRELEYPTFPIRYSWGLHTINAYIGLTRGIMTNITSDA